MELDWLQVALEHHITSRWSLICMHGSLLTSRDETVYCIAAEGAWPLLGFCAGYWQAKIRQPLSAMYVAEVRRSLMMLQHYDILQDSGMRFTSTLAVLPHLMACRWRRGGGR